MTTSYQIGGGVTISAGGKVYASKGVKIVLEGTTPQEIAAAVERLGKLPASAVTTSVRKGASTVRRVARMLAPRGATGELRRGIAVRSRKERTAQKGKTVYDVWMDPAKNNSFVKLSKTGKRAYYPASMEFGFPTANGGRVAGRYYLRTAAESTEPVLEVLVLDTAKKKLDQAWLKKQSGGGAT